MLKTGTVAFACAASGSQCWLFYRQRCWQQAAGSHWTASAQTHPAQQHSVYVIGGGIAAAATAYCLQKRGLKVAVLCDALCEEGSSSDTAAGGMGAGHGFKGPSAWFDMATQMMPWYSGYRFFGVGVDACVDPFFIRWLARFASESFFSTKAYRDGKDKLFNPVVKWAIGETVACADSVPALRAKSMMTSEPGAIGIIGGSGYKADKTATSISQDEAEKLEPMIPKVEGASFCHDPDYQFASCAHFTRSLWQYLKTTSVSVEEHSQVTGFLSEGRRVTGIQTSRGNINLRDNDQVVVCAGAWTGPLCDMLGVFVPIYPLTGYSIDVVKPGAQLPKHLVYTSSIFAVPLGEKLRMASIARLGGWTTQPDRQLEQALRDEAAVLFPTLADAIPEAKLHVGLRPYSADELPLLGRDPTYDNLHLNVGPGHSGWKCCIGFGEIVARELAGEAQPQLDGLALLRPAGRTGSSMTTSSMIRRLRLCLPGALSA